VCVVECDVTDRDRVQEFVAVARQKHGPIDVLINNAGIIQVGPIEEMRVEDFEQALFTNFWGALFTTLAVLPEMHARRTGRIVNIASIGGKIAVPHLLAYSASKFALVGLSQGLRAELRKSGIVVTTVCPGLMRTGSHLNASFKGQREQEYAWFALGGSMPGFSMNAERAARQIVAACARGDAEIVLGLPAKLAVAAQALAPNVMADLTALIDRFVLPRSGGTAAATAKGRDSRSQLPSVLTILSDRAAAANNETLAADLPPPLSTTHSA
jgi:short-subunit dehydrogenase